MKRDNKNTKKLKKQRQLQKQQHDRFWKKYVAVMFYTTTPGWYAKTAFTSEESAIAAIFKAGFGSFVTIVDDRGKTHRHINTLKDYDVCHSEGDIYEFLDCKEIWGDQRTKE